MTTFKDAQTGKKVSITMQAWDEDKQEMYPDMSYDILLDSDLEYDRMDDSWVVPDLDWVIGSAKAWQAKEADYNPIESDDHYERILDIEDVPDDE